MSLAKERTTQSSNMSLIQSFNGAMCNGNSGDASDTVGLLGFANYPNQGVESRSGVAPNNFSVGRLPSLVDPSNANGVIYGDMSSSELEEAQFVINFKSGYNNLVKSCGSQLSFEQREEDRLKIHKNNEEYPIWGDHVMDQSYQWNQPNPNSSNESRSSEDVNCFETASSYGTVNNNVKDNHFGDEGFTWLYSEVGASEESRGAESNQHKRPHMGGEMQASKKQRVVGSRKTKPAKIIQSKDPLSVLQRFVQAVYEKFHTAVLYWGFEINSKSKFINCLHVLQNRRERISERLKILQDLVPNGAKVDLVTMLEKAISYVKFLQLQVKILATDEFWPAQGGKAHEVSQVKEAIDAILSSQKDRNSSSK